MLRRIYLSLGRHYSFWKARSRALRITFRFHTFVFGVQDRLETGTAETKTFVSLAASTVKTLVATGALVAAFVYVNSWIELLFGPYRLTFQHDAYVQLLGAIAATGGVLIGLYYAAITSIAAVIYSHVPS